MDQNLPAAEAGVPLVVIGVVRSAHTEPESTPIQAALNRAGRAGRGTIEIAEPYREGLAGLDGFGYAWLLTWLHRPGGREGQGGRPPLRQVPHLLRSQHREMGIFATRGPRRVNPLGLSLIQLVDVTRETVEFAGVDVIDGTPVVDLKPYVTRFDRPPGDPPCGWFDEIDISDGSTPAQLGPAAAASLTGRGSAPPSSRPSGCRPVRHVLAGEVPAPSCACPPPVVSL